MSRILDPNRPYTEKVKFDMAGAMSEVLTKEYTVALARIAAAMCGEPRTDVMLLLAIRNIMNDNRQLRQELDNLKRSIYGEEKNQKEVPAQSEISEEAIAQEGGEATQVNATGSAP
jgi:hypothetical protein